MKLTEAQRKQVIEYYATQAAEDMPHEEVDQEAHLRDTRLEVQKALGKDLPDVTWDELVFVLVDAQQLDRFPGAHLHSMGILDLERNRQSWKEYYDDLIGNRIDDLAS